MASLTLALPVELSIALRKFAAEHDQSREDAALLAIREMLVTLGYLEVLDLDEETVTEGNA